MDPLFALPSIFHMKEIRNRESISKSKQGRFYIYSFLLDLIHGGQSRKIGELVESTEREGFEPSVNKSLHNSSNVTPSTTRPSLRHQDYV